MKVFSKIKKVITALIVSVAVFFSGQVFLPANFLHVKAADSTILYDNVSILDDLQDLDLAKYVKNENRHPEIIRFTEYCYSEKTSLNDYYSLYIYLYNPSGQAINTSTVEVNMALWFNDDGSVREYGKLKFQFLSCTEDNLLYKFKFASKVFLENQRRYYKKFYYRYYEIVGIEYKFSDGSSFNATDYDISKFYKFTGYSSYCSDNNENSLKCISDEAETVHLKLGNTNYRFPHKDKFAEYYLYDNLDTCYFSVPEELFTKYGDINKIKAEWYEYKTQPVFVTSDEGAFNAFQSFIGVDIGLKDNLLDYRVFWEESIEHSMTSQKHYYYFNHDYNGARESLDSVYHGKYNYTYEGAGDGNTITCMNWLFLEEDVKEASDYKISRSEMMNWAQNYNSLFDDEDSIITLPEEKLIETKQGKKYYKGLFTDSIDKVRQILLADQTQKNGKVVVEISAGKNTHITQEMKKNWWDFLWTGREHEDVYYDSILTVEPKDIELSAEEFCEKYKCNINDYEVKNCNHDGCLPSDCLRDIKSSFEESNKLGNRFILFRFAVTDYYSSTARFDMVGDTSMSDYDGYVAQETVFLDFDVISLTFRNANRVEKILGVVANPIDIINGVDPPDDLFPEEDWLMKILAIVALILVLVILGPFVSPILTIAFNLLGKLIAVLLKALALIFKFIWSILTFPFRLLKPK